MILSKVRSFVAWLFRRSQVEADMANEIRFHIESRASDLAARGVDPGEAARQARLEFGAIDKHKDEIRGARGIRWVDELRADFRYGARSLRRNPAFTVVATVSLALGIGANTLIFSVLDATFLRPLGYREPGRLAVIWTAPEKDRNQTDTSSVDTYFSLRDRSTSFESLGAFNGGGCGVRSLGADVDGVPAERIFGQCASPTFFEVLGVKPQIGRTFTEAEDQVGNVAAVVLISDGLWKRRFGGDPQILGKAITLNRIPTTVIGVLPADFELFKDPNSEATRTLDVDFIIPLELTPTQVQSRVGGLTIVGRLKPSVSVQAAQSEIDALTAQLAIADAERHQGLSARVEPFQRAAYRSYWSPLLILETAVALVLLIGCANVAGLLLARGAGRRNEVALRMALGGSRGRVVRQLVTENLPAAFLGGAGGLLLSWGGLHAFRSIAPADFARLDEVTLDGRVLAFTALAIVLSGVLSAIGPALQISKLNLVDSLKDSGRSATWSATRLRLRGALVIGQIALAMVLLIGAGLFIRSFVRVIEQDLGADPSDLLTFDFRLTQAETVKPFGRYRGMGLWDISPVPAQRFERVLERLEQMPGIRGVAATSIAPFRDQRMSMPFLIEGRPVPPSAGSSGIGFAVGQQFANYVAVTRGFFQVMKVPLLKGRDFNDRDSETAPLVMVINETLARRHFPNEDPIGKRITLDWVPDEKPREIVGVVADTLVTPLQREQAATVYVPHLQQTAKFTGPGWSTRAGMYFVLRTSVEPRSLEASLKSAVAEVDRNTPVADMRTMKATIDNQVRNLRLYMLLIGIFAAVATVLASTGIYGVMSYSVAERRREIGIRMALGAGSRDVLSMMVRQASSIIGIGLLIGSAVALGVSRVLESALYGVSATDLPTYAAVAIVLLFTATIACLIPTKRAIAVDPTVSLKED